MFDFFKKVTGEKKRWRQVEARAKKLPKDYQIVYDEIKGYMFRYPSGTGMDLLPVLEELLGLFEGGVANRKGALELTGEDVAGFCDELLRSVTTYAEKSRQSLNRDIQKRIGKHSRT